MKTTKLLTIWVLALGLIVWLTPMAHGAQYLTVNGQDVNSITLKLGQACMVNVISDDSNPYTAYIGFDDVPILGVFLHLETMSLAGNLASATVYNVSNFNGFHISAAGSAPAPSAGIHFVFEYIATQLCETDLKLYNSTFTSVIDSIRITVIPTSMGTAFTYQGWLMDSNSPADGLYDFEFKIFDSPDPVSAVLLESIDINDLDVIDGQFALELDFGSGVFDGDSRWLETTVMHADGSDPCILRPRIKVTPVPYALHTRGLLVDDAGNVGIGTNNPNSKLEVTGASGAPIISVTNTGNGSGVYAWSQDGFGLWADSASTDSDSAGVYGRGSYGHGVHGVTVAGSAYGVYGETAAFSTGAGVKGQSDLGHGVIGNTNAYNKAGVYGWSNNGVGVEGRSDKEYGVVGWTDANDKSGVYGWSNNGVGVTGRCDANNHGIFGATFSSDPNHAGVFGKNNGSGRGVWGEALSVGVAGKAMSYDGVGVFGEAPRVGVAGKATGGPVIGVYGEASNTGHVTNYGGSFWASGTMGKAVHGYASNTGDVKNHGGYFEAHGQRGVGVFAFGHVGVHGLGGDVGVRGEATDSNSTGVVGKGVSYDFFADGAGTNYGAPSSIRWKSDIRAIDEPLGKVLRMRGVYFNWDADHGGHHDVGMIAEEVGEVLPEVVEYEEDGKYTSGMDYSKLTPLLIEAVKAIKTELDERQKELEKKDSEIAELKERLSALEASVTKLMILDKADL